MTSEFDEIFSRFYLKITDYNIATLDENVVNEMINGWLKSAASKPYVRRIFSSFVLDEDIGEIEYQMRFSSGDDDLDKDFVEEVLAKAMVQEWLTPAVDSVLNTQQAYVGKETNYFSQAKHLYELKDMLAKEEKKVRRFIQDRGFMYNSYLKD